MIGVLNYGVGNVKAFLNCYATLNLTAISVSLPSEIESCSHLILPGVGSFDHAMREFNNSGLRDGMERHTILEKKPLLGVCVGMQMLSRSSEEGVESGLGFIQGDVLEFEKEETIYPHMGWNTVIACAEHSILENITENSEFYFLHSFYFHADRSSNILAKTQHGRLYASIISERNIYGIQCHPEKSHAAGLSFLKSFAELNQC